MKQIYISLLMVLAVTACQDNTVESDAPIHDNVMRFNLVGPDVQTKVSAGAFEAADQIGLYVTDYVNETTPMPLQISGNRANNSLVTFNGSIWTPDQTIYWGSGKSDVYAYYPYFETVTDVNSQYFELATDQTGEGYDLSDFLWAKAEGVRQTDGAVNLEMKHLMSKLTVKIVAGEDYIGSLPEDATVHLHSTVTNVNIDLEKGSVVKDPYSGAKSIKMNNLGIRTFDGEKAVVYEAIVVPQMLENSVPLLEINSKSVSYLLEDPFNFRPGIAYTYTATLNTSTTAIKVEIGCELEDWNSAGDVPGDSEEPDGGSEDETDDIVYTDLSANGTANCYLVQRAGNYQFKSVVGNTNMTAGNVKTVEVLWESFGTDEMPETGDIIASAAYKNGYIRFSTPDELRNGNALIAAKNSDGVILWSWHIWCSEYGWKQVEFMDNSTTMMDVDLGSVKSIHGGEITNGLVYQWGRKDPFMPLNIMVATGVWQIMNMDYPTYEDFDTNPMTLYNPSNGGIGYLNDSTRWSDNKTINDPCPSGWFVPTGDQYSFWSKLAAERLIESLPYVEGQTSILLSDPICSPDTWFRLHSGYWTSLLQDEHGPRATFIEFGESWDYINYNDYYTFSFNYTSDPNSTKLIRCQKE